MKPITKFKNRFGKTKVVLPVIHAQTLEQVIKNAELAFSLGADGVWLISHGDISNNEVVSWQSSLITMLGWNQIGVNLLGINAGHAFGMVCNVGMGVWVDNAGIGDFGVAQAESIQPQRELLEESLYFGGVSFKYQAPVTDLTFVTETAQKYVDVITTSGAGTGKAASIKKIATMRDAAPEHPLAIASGITAENVTAYLPYANAFLVATGINMESDFYNIDPEKLKRLIEVVNACGL